MATEEPPYDVVEQLGEVEIRSYAAVVLAETEVEGTFGEVSSAAFRRLAGYIFGGNRVRGAAGENAKIAMTAPVAMRPAGNARIAMTAPVGMRPVAADGDTAPAPGGAERWVMSFAMPSVWTLATLPEPTDPGVTLREAPARQIAVLRFSGLWSVARFAEQERQLRAELATSGWQVAGPVESLRYDPPWTLWFLRRNEVALPVVRAAT
ncbi:MAG: heme-binding protein [Thermoanaerobaculia bacterium]